MRYHRYLMQPNISTALDHHQPHEAQGTTNHGDTPTTAGTHQQPRRKWGHPLLADSHFNRGDTHQPRGHTNNHGDNGATHRWLAHIKEPRWVITR